ncbi:MAG: hypothetical protein KGJ98_01350 [Chloroflexota bacterium]|nr:hypothetical protein [Chloroflexota bacterium]
MSLRPLDQRTQGGAAASARVAGAPPRRRGVLGGLVVFAIGLAFLLQALSFPAASAFLFIALGGAFVAAYVLGYRQYVYLVPGAVLVGLGIGLLLPTVFDLGQFAAPIFFGALAAALVCVTLLAPDRRWLLIPAVPLAVIAIAGVFGRVDLVPVAAQPFILPLVLMLVGAYLLVEPSSR